MNIKELYLQSYIKGKLAKKEAAPYKGAVGRQLYAIRSLMSKEGPLKTINKQFPFIHYDTLNTFDNLKRLTSRYQDIYFPEVDYADFMRHIKKHPGVRELLMELRKKDLMYASDLRKNGLTVFGNKVTREVAPELYLGKTVI